METESLTEINSATDIVTARQRGRALALELGFNGADVTLIAAAISEVARNIVDHAKKGEIVMSSIVHSANPASRSSRATKAPASATSRRRCSTATRRAKASAWACPARNG
jgi:hypothetical protein